MTDLLKFKHAKTDRGFRIVSFDDSNGNCCTLQDSSAVDPHVWVGCGEGRMHLTPNQAAQLIPYLYHFCVHEELPDGIPKALRVWEKGDAHG